MDMSPPAKKFMKAAQMAEEQGYSAPEEAKENEGLEAQIPKGEKKTWEKVKEKPIEPQDKISEPKNLTANIAAFKKDHCPEKACPYFQNGAYEEGHDPCDQCYEDSLIQPQKDKAQATLSASTPKLDARHKPEYGDFTTFTFERTISIRQFEPFRVQATYKIGKDDLLSDIVKKSKDFNTAIEEAYHVSAQPQAQTQHPMGGPPPAPPTISYPDNADKVSGASEKQIRKCYAVWHQMGEPANLKPSGKWSRKEASDYIDKYDRQGQNQGGDKPFPTPEERGYRTRFY